MPVGGIIPARAGSTTRLPRTRTKWRDHPRSRGVDSTAAPGRRSDTGSSPLARGRRSARGQRDPPAPDHPRSRGVDSKLCCGTVLADGSSPLARGRHRRKRGPPQPWGIIPARAGSTVLVAGCGQGLRDHPRSRGVDNISRAGSSWRMGSSPLARGRPKLSFTSHPRIRIIPARAGSTSLSGLPR